MSRILIDLGFDGKNYVLRTYIPHLTMCVILTISIGDQTYCCRCFCGGVLPHPGRETAGKEAESTSGVCLVVGLGLPTWFRWLSGGFGTVLSRADLIRSVATSFHSTTGPVNAVII